MGVGLFTYSAKKQYWDISISRDDSGIAMWDDNPREGRYLRIPSSLDIIKRLPDDTDLLGYIVDEDLGDDDLEVVVSELDTELKRIGVRGYIDILAKSSNIRDPGDIVKMILLGADSVIIPSSILDIAVGQGNRDALRRKAFNLVAGMKKEIVLISGAAGVYSMQSSMTGNRELLRAVNLSDRIASVIRVRQAGSL